MHRTILGHAGVLALVFFTAFAPLPASAQTAVDCAAGNIGCPPADSFSIFIQSVDNVQPGRQVTVDIIAEPSSNVLDSFNLRIVYDSALMTFLSAQQGQLFADCNADLFSYETTNNGEIIIRHELGADTCTQTVTEPTVIASMTFMVEWNPFIAGARLPIRFYWTDCIDNMFSCSTPSYQLMARIVHDYDGSVFPYPFLFPTYGGVPGWCITCDTTVDVIDFFNGYVGISDEILPARGDCNGDGLAFTIADLELFREYFTAPCVSPDTCGCGDVNGDGVENHVSDLVYMSGVVAGDISPDPVPAPSDFNAYIFHDIANKEIILTGGGGAVSGVTLMLSGNFNPTNLPPEVSMFYQDGGMSYLTLMLSPMMLSGAEDELRITYQGLPYIEEAQASSPDGILMYPDIFRTGQYSIEVDIIRPQTPPYGVPLGDTVTLDVMLDGPPAVLDFLELQLAYDADDLTFLDAQGNGWETFDYRTGPEGACLEAECPSGIVHFTASNIIEGLSDGASTLSQKLFSMRFVVTEAPQRAGAFLPIKFLWSSCADNRLVSTVPQGKWASASAWDYLPGPDMHGNITEPGAKLPTLGGAPSSCVVNNDLFTHRYLDFYSGGIQLIDSAFLNVRGDLDVNGVAFNSDDALKYVDFFLKGTSVFPETVRELAIYASDCDLDGDGLSPEDFMYLWNVLRGNFTADEPARDETPASTLFHRRSDGIVSFDSQDTLGAIWLTFDGQILNPRLFSQASHLSIGHYFDGAQTSVFVSVWEANEIINPGLLFYFDGPAVLSEACAATIDAESVPCKVDVATDIPDGLSELLPDEYSLAQNYPNPFNPTSTIRYAVPQAGQVRLDVYNVTGQLVTTLVDRWVAAGHYEVVWEGRNASGTPVASGVYFYRLTAGDYSESRKMVLLK